MIPGIFDAACRYRLEELRKASERVISHGMNIENVIEFLVLADQSDAQDLKKQALGMIIIYAKAVIKTAGFKRLRESKRIDLLAEAFCALATGKV